ncbi:flavodoxin [Curtanaerobium respiraculi]|uniref:flavodoxin n=1 Tax=Curtanaerobium respiraculi TaxID=2949669 RepID=UPI0024B38F1F|nr:flavodoxin [Curtanaerobium respiraculi]
MSKIAVVFWSGSGNTEKMADIFAEGVKEAGGEAEILQARDFDSSMVGDYDAFGFGCPAMGDEELEETEFEPMFSDVEHELGDKKTVLFGSYSWNDGEWMDNWAFRASNAGVNVVETVIAYEAPGVDETAELKEAAAKLL